MTANNAEQAYWSFARTVLEIEWFVNNYRYNRMYRDGRVFGLFYVEPNSVRR